jgi:hypothetical protein
MWKEHPVPTGQEAGWAPELVWTRWWREKYPICQEMNPGRPGRSLVFILTELPRIPDEKKNNEVDFYMRNTTPNFYFSTLNSSLRHLTYDSVLQTYPGEISCHVTLWCCANFIINEQDSHSYHIMFFHSLPLFTCTRKNADQGLSTESCLFLCIRTAYNRARSVHVTWIPLQPPCGGSSGCGWRRRPPDGG